LVSCRDSDLQQDNGLVQLNLATMKQ